MKSKRILNILIVPLALYWLAAFLLLHIADMGLIRYAALAWKLPWLEDACKWFCMPMISGTCIGIAGILLHKWSVRRRTRREAQQVIAQLQSDTEKKDSP